MARPPHFFGYKASTWPYLDLHHAQMHGEGGGKAGHEAALVREILQDQLVPKLQPAGGKGDGCQGTGARSRRSQESLRCQDHEHSVAGLPGI